MQTRSYFPSSASSGMRISPVAPRNRAGSIRTCRGRHGAGGTA
jgi:hypothetical protein